MIDGKCTNHKLNIDFKNVGQRLETNAWQKPVHTTKTQNILGNVYFKIIVCYVQDCR